MGEENITLLLLGKENPTATTRHYWKEGEISLPLEFVALVKSIEESVKLIVVYAIVNKTRQDKTKQTSSDDATTNINARLTHVEEFVGASYEDTVWDKYPTVTIAIGEVLETFKTQAFNVGRAMEVATEQEDKVRLLQSSTQNNRTQTLIMLRSVVDQLKSVEAIAIENRENMKCIRPDARDDVLTNDFMELVGLGTCRYKEQREGPEDNIELSLIHDKISTLDKSVEHMSDILGAICKF
eukprot:6572828-Ditylum_brightwellii.AAC.1